MAWKPKPAHIPRFTESLAAHAARAAVMEASKELVRFADREAGIFSRRIQAQRVDSFHTTPLSRSTLEKKRMYKRSLRVMVSTGTYASQIRAFAKAGPRGGLTVRIGHAPNLLARDTRTGRPRPGVLMSRVAAIQELGAPRAKIPARPHWRPGMAILRKRSPAERRRILLLAAQVLRRRLGIQR